MDLSSVSGKKIAGIPVLYFALIVAAASLYGAWKMKGTPADSTAATDAQATDGTGNGASPDLAGDLPDTSQPVFSATPVIYQTSGVSVSSTPQEDTNALWAKRSVEWLLAHGFTTDTASNAITKYLDGAALSYDEGRARDAAIKQFGLPPEDVLATTAAGKPKPKPAPEPAPKPHKYYRSTSRTNTAAEIAAKNGISVAHLHSLNPHMHFPVKPHTRVRVQ